MAAIDFPNSPTNGDTYDVGGDTYAYFDGTWAKVSGSPVSKNLFTQKGDLIVGTGSGNVTNLAPGTDNYYLKTNSSTATGLEWGPVPSISELSDVPDVTITSPATDDVLMWNGSAWVNDARFKLLSTYSFNQRTSSYTLVLGDENKIVEMSVASANNLTVPTDASVNFPVGSQVHILQTGAGQTTVVASSGVTVNGTPGLKLRAQWAYATLIKRASNTWVLVGDLAA